MRLFNNEEQLRKEGFIFVNSPRKEPPYRVFWNWDMLYECNYKCTYCDFANGRLPTCSRQEQGIYNKATLSEWKEVWDRIFNQYYSGLVRLSGGEPSIHPLFYKLVRLLQEKHIVDITTNLNFDINYFIKNIPPDNIGISASFHPQFSTLENFLEKAMLFQNRGYRISVCIVSYPPFLDKLEYFKGEFENRNFNFKISPFNGKYQGKDYPKAFSEEERRLLKKLANESPDPNMVLLNRKWYEWKVEKETSIKSKVCRMGQMYAKILPNGDVFRCCHPDSGFLGNIFVKDFKLLDAAEPCNVGNNCPCFKAMVAGEEDIWFPLWKAPEHSIYNQKRCI